MTRALLLLLALVTPLPAADPWVVYKGGEGPGKGKHVVLVSGDEEYRSEEALPQLGRILARHHGFTCTVLFAIDKNDGTINPMEIRNIPGLEALAKADLMVHFLRWRDLPDEQMKPIVDYVAAGKPMVALRTSTHAFKLGKSSKYRTWTWDSREWPGGFGKQLLGETWLSHHGHHGKEATRGIVAPDAKDSPIVRGIKDGDIFGPSDVYGVRLPLPGDSKPIVLGQVVAGMKPTDPPVKGKKNDPMMPIAWTKTYSLPEGKPGRVFTSTMCCSQDLESEGLRRLLVNGCYWALGMESQIPERSKVDLVGEYKPLPFKSGAYKKGVKPEDLKLD
jgi:hypothetical protein